MTASEDLFGHELANITDLENLYFPATGPVRIRHNGTGPIPARSYLLENKAEATLVNRFFTAEGFWKEQLKGTEDLYSLAPRQLDTRLQGRLSSAYELATVSLDGLTKHGYNEHGLRHIRPVVNYTVTLLNLAGHGDDVIRRAVMAAWGHDLGNLVDRQNHGGLAPKVFSLVVPEVENDEEQWKIVSEAMQNHDHKIARVKLAELGATSRLEEIQLMRINFTPESLALIIADKIQIGRNRISRKVTDISAVEDDKHIQLNLLGHSKNVRLEDEGKTFVWELEYDPMRKSDDTLDPSLYREQSSAQGERIHVSDRVHNLYREHGIPHSAAWEADFWKEYFDRIAVTIQASFALFPNAETVKIKIKTGKTREVTFAFDQKEIDAQLNEVRQMYRLQKP